MTAAAVHKNLYIYNFHDKNSTFSTFRQALISPLHVVFWVFLTFTIRFTFLNLLLVIWNSCFHDFRSFPFLKLPSASLVLFLKTLFYRFSLYICLESLKTPIHQVVDIRMECKILIKIYVCWLVSGFCHRWPFLVFLFLLDILLKGQDNHSHWKNVFALLQHRESRSKCQKGFPSHRVR